MKELESIIEEAYAGLASITARSPDKRLKDAVSEVIAGLNAGQLRVAEKRNGEWVVNQWVKKAVLLSFRINENAVMDGQFTKFYDKVPLKYATYDGEAFQQEGARVVPPAVARTGAYVASNVVLMPSFVNIGVYIDKGTMIDSWATVGSCAQIGKNVHIAANVVIGGVLEPLQANPVIIEDDCFVGAGSAVVEGVIVETGAVISMGVYLGQSTRIFDRESGKVTYGRVPAGSIVVSGAIPSKDGTHSLYCAVIVKRVDQETRKKVGINQILRESE
jgi:2,3,4,5-tetrahydropyridine-2-carboxylate N-succinyltransferase